MTIDEWIEFAETKAKEHRERYTTCADDPEWVKYGKIWEKEYQQLAEWLRELKAYRERIPSYEAGYNDAKREIALSGEYKIAYQRGYEKAMEYCTNKLEEVNKQMEVNADADSD